MSEPISIGKFLTAKEIPNIVGRKTKVWEICSKRHGDLLGEVRWYPAWRQYTVGLVAGSIWNDDCLLCVANFLKKCNMRQVSVATVK